jgi:hypothetical protein
MKTLFLFVMLHPLSCGLLAQNAASKKTMGRLINDNMLFAAKQYKVLKQNTPQDRMPRSFDPKENKSITSDTKVVVQWFLSGYALVHLRVHKRQLHKERSGKTIGYP